MKNYFMMYEDDFEKIGFRTLGKMRKAIAEPDENDRGDKLFICEIREVVSADGWGGWCGPRVITLEDLKELNA